MSIRDQALEYHRKTRGKIATQIKCVVETKEDLSLAYTPGVGEVSKAIAEDKSILNEVTNRGNTVAIVSDGSAVLGLGNIGPEAAMAVMEGKAVLFKKFGNVDAVPICLNTQDAKKIIEIVQALEPTFGGINLEDISAPRCFEIEAELKRTMNIPIFHDDQHGTAIVVLAALINAVKLVKKEHYRFEATSGTDPSREALRMTSLQIVFSGAGAAGVAVAKLLHLYGFKNITMCDTNGIISSSRTDLNESKKALLEFTNPRNLSGSLTDALKGADVFIGVSGPGIVTADMVATMNKDAIVFAMANPVPEIMPDEAKKGGARIVATGRSDFPNQINNVLAFPGVFRGVFDFGAKAITDEMKVAAAEAIAGLISDTELKEDYIIPSPFDERVVDAVAKAIQQNVRS